MPDVFAEVTVPLEIQRGKSPWWYGRVYVNGRYYCKNLGVEIRGKIPPTIKKLGDHAFERSRLDAQAALNTLPEKLRLVVVMSVYQGQRYDDIAAALGVPVGTVKSRMFLAMGRLKEFFDVKAE